MLAAAGYRVIIPYLRGYGTTRFLSAETPRNGQQAALAVDIIALMDALEIEKAIVAGFDWGARTADIVAALWPERCKALVSVSGYLIGSQAAGNAPLPPTAELQWWYQFYFATERGRAGYEKYTHDFAKLIWQLASPHWKFDDATFDRSAAALRQSGSRRHRRSTIIAGGSGSPRAKRNTTTSKSSSPRLRSSACRRSRWKATPTARRIPSPAPMPRSSRAGTTHRLITGGIGHNLPQEAPQAFAKAVIDADGGLSIHSMPRSGAAGPRLCRDPSMKERHDVNRNPKRKIAPYRRLSRLPRSFSSFS